MCGRTTTFTRAPTHAVGRAHRAQTSYPTPGRRKRTTYTASRRARRRAAAPTTQAPPACRPSAPPRVRRPGLEYATATSTDPTPRSTRPEAHRFAAPDAPSGAAIRIPPRQRRRAVTIAATIDAPHPRRRFGHIDLNPGDCLRQQLPRHPEFAEQRIRLQPLVHVAGDDGRGVDHIGLHTRDRVGQLPGLPQPNQLAGIKFDALAGSVIHDQTPQFLALNAELGRRLR